MVFSGVGKTAGEIEYALKSGIDSFNCESEARTGTDRAKPCRLGLKARFSLRVNPDVDAATHPYITTGLRDHKFGIDIDAGKRSITAQGTSGICGRLASAATSARRILDYSPPFWKPPESAGLVERLQAAGCRSVTSIWAAASASPIRRPTRLPEIASSFALMRRPPRSGLDVMIEPGRSIVGDAGVLLTRVMHRKKSP